MNMGEGKKAVVERFGESVIAGCALKRRHQSPVGVLAQVLTVNIAWNGCGRSGGCFSTLFPT